jgi:putative ABC transport system permease protein
MQILDRETWVEIYYSLSKNKLRTILTMIGVAWGMFLYVFLLGAAKGAENGFYKIFDGYATNSIFLWGGSTGEPYKGYPRGRDLTIHLDDVEYLKKQVPEIDFVVPRNAASSEQSVINRKNKSKNFTVFGDFASVSKVQKKQLITGRLLNDEDDIQKKKVTIIGKEVYEQLFNNNENAIGQYIKINGIYFQVVGVYRNPNSGFLPEDVVYIPFNTYQKIYNQGDRVNWMVISIKPQYNVNVVEEKIKAALRKKYDVAPTDEKAFGAWNFAENFRKLTNFLKGLQILTWFVGGLTILAGVVAISNILLITVKERTLEIGIRRALGAKPGEIRIQILMESVFLTVLSGLLGFILGVLLLIGMSSFMGDANPKFPFYNPTVNIWNVLAALFLMVSLGLFIGLIPAQRAVQIKPIEALRTE